MNRLRKCLLLHAAAVALFAIGCNRASTPNEHFQAGVGYFKEQKYARAAAHFEKVVAALPAHAQARNFLAVCQLREGKTDDAVKNLQEALRLDPNYTAARCNLGLALLEQGLPANGSGAGKPAEAIAALRQAAAAADAPKDIQYLLGLAYMRDSAWVQADQAFTKYLQTEPKSVDTLNNLGFVCVRQHEYKRATTYFEQAIAADAKYAPSYLNLAVVEDQHLGDKPKALGHYKRYSDLAPKAQRADVSKVVARLSQELAPAEPSPVVVATKPPVPVSATKIVTTTTVRAVSRPPATTVVARVTSPAPSVATRAPSRERGIVTNLSPSVPVAQKRVAVVAPVKKKRTPIAVKSLRAGDRTKATVYFNDGVKLHQQHNLTGAIAAYTKAATADPTLAIAYYNAAIAYRELGQISKALDNYELALIANPAYTDARHNYAILLEQQSYLDDAIVQYESILRVNRADAAAHRAVAAIYARDPATISKARQHYEAYLRLAPDSPLARDIQRWLDQTH
ncbi:MAG: tetratricopeptide repeat protein [Verrucomicrobiia bacterium]